MGKSGKRVSGIGKNEGAVAANDDTATTDDACHGQGPIVDLVVTVTPIYHIEADGIVPDGI